MRDLGAVAVDELLFFEFFLAANSLSKLAGWRSTIRAWAPIVAAEHQVDPSPGGREGFARCRPSRNGPCRYSTRYRYSGILNGNVHKHLLDAPAESHAIDEVLHVIAARSNGQVGELVATRRAWRRSRTNRGRARGTLRPLPRWSTPRKASPPGSA